MVDENENLVINNELTRKSKQNIEQLNLSEKFKINKVVYDEFFNSIIFDEYGNFRGAKVTGINKSLNEEEREKFWKYFGLTYKNGDFPQNTNKDLVFMDYKPRFRGCKWDPDWICVIYTDATETK